MISPTARLLVKRGPHTNQEFPLTQAKSTLGRSQHNDIVLADPEVSRQHAQITLQDDVYIIADWGSTNGTFVNGQRVVGQARLQNGDNIELGDAVQLTFLQTTLVPPEPDSFDAGASDAGLNEPNADSLEVAEPASWPLSDPMAPSPDEWFPVEPLAAEVSPIALETDKVDGRLGLGRGSSKLLGCGCLVLILVLFCFGTLFFLDSYQQGRYLYCGTLRSFWEALLNPLGFEPLCP